MTTTATNIAIGQTFGGGTSFLIISSILRLYRLTLEVRGAGARRAEGTKHAQRVWRPLDRLVRLRPLQE